MQFVLMPYFYKKKWAVAGLCKTLSAALVCNKATQFCQNSISHETCCQIRLHCLESGAQPSKLPFHDEPGLFVVHPPFDKLCFIGWEIQCSCIVETKCLYFIFQFLHPEPYLLLQVRIYTTGIGCASRVMVKQVMYSDSLPCTTG